MCSWDRPFKLEWCSWLTCRVPVPRNCLLHCSFPPECSASLLRDSCSGAVVCSNPRSVKTFMAYSSFLSTPQYVAKTTPVSSVPLLIPLCPFTRPPLLFLWYLVCTPNVLGFCPCSLLSSSLGMCGSLSVFVLPHRLKSLLFIIRSIIASLAVQRVVLLPPLRCVALWSIGSVSLHYYYYCYNIL